MGVGGIAEELDDAGLAGGAKFEAAGDEGEGLLAGVCVGGLGEAEGAAPGGDAAGGLREGTGLGLFELGDDAFDEGIALEELDVGLDVAGEVVSGVGDGVELLGVHEVLVHGLDFEGGARLVDGCLGEGEQATARRTPVKAKSRTAPLRRRRMFQYFEEATGSGVFMESRA